MAGNSRTLFKIVSMLLVAASLYSAFGTLSSGEVRFWISLCVTSLMSIAFLIMFIKYDRETAVSHKDNEDASPDNSAQIIGFFLSGCPFPAIILDNEGRILKITRGAAEQFQKVSEGRMLSECLFDLEKYKDMTEFKWDHYKVSVFRSQMAEETEKVFTLLSFRDMRELDSLKDEAEDNRNYVANIHIDNINELFYKAADSDKALIIAQIDKMTEQFIENHNGILKKLSDGSYFAIISEKEIKALTEEKFSSFLTEAHKITVSDQYPVTLSMGIGRGGASLRESEIGRAHV